MIKKIITTAVQCFIICLAAEAVRQTWNDKEEDKKENK